MAGVVFRPGGQQTSLSGDRGSPVAGRGGALEAEESRRTEEESEACEEQPGGHCA